jgi:hypothetical protein
MEVAMKVIRCLGAVALSCAIGAAPADAQTKKSTPKPPTPQISAATREKAAEDHANPDALVLADFQKRIDAYMNIHRRAQKDSPPLKETNDPAKIKMAQQALGARIRVLRADAKPGDILTPEIRNKLRRLMYPVVEGTKGHETKEELKEDVREKDESVPKKVPLTVNATYPEGDPLPTTPPNVLLSLPKLPEELEYRIIDKNLILRDVQANIIVDYVPNAIQ